MYLIWRRGPTTLLRSKSSRAWGHKSLRATTMAISRLQGTGMALHEN